MKLLQLGKAYPPANLGGVEIVIQLLTEGLNDHGIVCDALGVNDIPVYKIEEYKQGKIYRAKLLKKKFSTLLSFQLPSLLKKITNQYDIITIHSPDPMACLALWLVKPKCKVVLYWHSDILKQKLLLTFYNPLLNWLLKRADKIIATSPNYINGSKYLSKHFSKCEVIPIGIDHPQKVENINNEYKRFEHLKNRKIIFSLGRLAYYKGYEFLVKSAKEISDDAVILIAGAGEENDKLINIIDENSLHEKVFLLGKISEEEKEFLFKNAKIFALSSIYKTEAYAIVQVEALSYGLPIISTKIPGSGVDWVNKDKETGIIVPIRDSLSISKAINSLLNDEELYKKYSENAYNRYSENFTKDKMIEKIIALYNKLLV